MSRQVSAIRRQYDPTVINHAAQLVTDGSLSPSHATKSFNIPKTSLYDPVHQSTRRRQLALNQS